MAYSQPTTGSSANKRPGTVPSDGYRPNPRSYSLRNQHTRPNSTRASQLDPTARSFQMPEQSMAHSGAVPKTTGMCFEDLVFHNQQNGATANEPSYSYYPTNNYDPQGYYNQQQEQYNPYQGGYNSDDHYENTSQHGYSNYQYAEYYQNSFEPSGSFPHENTIPTWQNGQQHFRPPRRDDKKKNFKTSTRREFQKHETTERDNVPSSEKLQRNENMKSAPPADRAKNGNTRHNARQFSQNDRFYHAHGSKDHSSDISKEPGSYPGKTKAQYLENDERKTSARPKGGKQSRSEASQNSEGKQSHGNSRAVKDSKKKKTLDISFTQNGKLFKSEELETQRGRLIDELMNNTYECMVCCDVIQRDIAVWSCCECYHVYHLFCIKKWARSPAATVEGTDGGWRCPACQNVTLKVPSQYRCFCARQRDPQFSHYETPHSCGEVCGKTRRGHCNHACNILCHPGPCPTCNASVTKKCNCGKITQTIKCSQAAEVKCQAKCSKTLNCGKHTCEEICHSGSCKPCEEQVEQVCYCSNSKRTVLCGSKDSYVTVYNCEKLCKRELSCGNHHCEKPCHAGDCDSCVFSPEMIHHCPCGKTTLKDLTENEREKCTDPVPTCKEICDKELICGPESKHHRCLKQCHEGDCPVCTDGITPVSCRCESMVKELSCQQAEKHLLGDTLLCNRRCTKKRSCGKHKCQQPCCVDKQHACTQICGRILTCGLHRCEEPCHRGNCQNCWNVCFEEITCHCGSSVLEPPIQCGTKPPECHQICRRDHPCQHQVRHNCHSEDKCPPCTELTKKMCHGEHELRHNIPCHIAEVSCGLPCKKPLPCKQHKCSKICHKDACLPEGLICQQPCQRVREWCDHICGAVCHVGKSCPENTCKAKLQVKCACGQRTGLVVCGTGKGDAPGKVYQQMTSSAMAGKILYLGNGQSVDLNSLNAQKKTRQLECDENCAKIERNRRVALALQIENPDLSDKLGAPNYNQFLRDFARANPNFVADIEKALADLVQNAKTSKYPNRSHSFRPMKREQRRLIHELAEFYGCKTQSYDYEPVKSVVATAYKDKCWMPNMTLTVAIRRETQPSAPMPIPHNSTEKELRAKSAASKQSTNALNSAEGSDTTKTKNVTKSKFIDYFDFED